MEEKTFTDQSNGETVVKRVFEDADNTSSEPTTSEHTQQVTVEADAITDENNDVNRSSTAEQVTAETDAIDNMNSSSIAAKKDDMQSLYHVKWISWRNERTPIVTQNENGPCPLLAIFNVLLLSRKVTLGSDVEIMTSNQITAHVADVIWENMPRELPDEERLNYEQNVSDAMSVFPNLQTGLDVNVKFSTVASFEYTPELTVFDLLRIPLYHGWLVDPQDSRACDIIGNNSYNQIVEKIVNCLSSENETTVEKGLIAQQFLESSASQITCHGIVSLCEQMNSGDLAVLFRNNHFSTLYRHKDELFTLITDFGFLQESNVVWETLSGVHGDSNFVDGNFLNTPPKTETSNSPQNTDYDLQIALSMQQDMPETASAPQKSDYEYALQLHEEELREQRRSPSGSAHAVQPRPQTAQASPSRGTDHRPARPTSAPHSTHVNENSNNKNCIIL
uniref:ubiquitin carboxyl-terminal hydrolase MINDY-2-like n=1 Tax=Styela clava TaxID=7725 RepID=UPI00193A10C3|nr:ubiquitin carboxyl-terminal hydrolase MINDY-2-like [Styela clava]